VKKKNKQEEFISVTWSKITQLLKVIGTRISNTSFLVTQPSAKNYFLLSDSKEKMMAPLTPLKDESTVISQGERIYSSWQKTAYITVQSMRQIVFVLLTASFV
jgi:hypothetical protein